MGRELIGSQSVFIIIIQGRLGNMLFDYAFLLSLRAKYPEHKGYLYRDKNAPGTTGYLHELEMIFNISAADFASEALMDFVKSLPRSSVRIIREKGFACRPFICLDDTLVTICMGYWQTETAFDNVKPEVRKAFSFNRDILNKQTRQLAEKLNSTDAIALHVRRGDYFIPDNIDMYGGICTIDYYREALDVICKRVDDKLPVYCFSDDPNWVKSELYVENCTVVDWNNGEESWQDMYLMSLCLHNVIANSTFSWWGAWLNPHKDKIVVAPYRCFNTMLTPEIHPDEWVSIYPKGYVKNDLVWKLEKNKISLERNGLFYGKMGVAVFLFHYASVYQDEYYENVAMNLISSVFSQIHAETSIDYADGLSGIGCAIEYLHQNEFIEGDIDEILADLDVLFDQVLYDSRKRQDVRDNLWGLIRYYRFRLSGKSKERDGERMKKNELNMFYLLGLMKKDGYCSISEGVCLTELSVKHVARMEFGEGSGLKGMAGKELMRMFPETNVDWTKLL